MASSRYPRLRRTTVAVALTVVVAGAGSVFGAFTATTTSPGNSVATGTVAIADSDGGTTAVLYAPTAVGLGPTDSTVSCIHVTYTGTLPATVKLYAAATVTDGAAFTVDVERGTGLTGPFPTCTGFTATSTAFTGALSAVPTSWTAGVEGRAAGAAWAPNDAVDYRFTVRPVDVSTPNARSTRITTAPHTYTWEARSS